MKLTLLGTGTPETYRRRASSSYLIDVGDDTLMFDCGGGAVSRVLDAGRDIKDLNYLFFSHLHSDHMMDFARLAHALWDEGQESLAIFSPAPLQNISDRYFSKNGPLAFDLIARTKLGPSQEIWQERGGTLPRPWPSPNITEIEPGFTMQGADWTVRSVRVPHAQPFLNSMGYRVDAHGKSVVYSGDSGPCKGLTDLAKGADILIHMFFNLSQEARSPQWLKGSSGHIEIANTAQQAGVKTVILTHIRQQVDTPEIHYQIIKEMAEIYSGNVIIGEDLMTFDL